MRPAEALLTELGISDPADIDLPAIADCQGVAVQYRPLNNCEAQIIGYKAKAIVYVSTTITSPARRRFSTAHELGHWHHHRGQSFACRSIDIGRPIDGKSKDAERQADAYGSDLILPPFMVAPRITELGEISLDGIAELAGKFRASVTATAIRTIKLTRQPLILVAHNLYGKTWPWPSLTAGGLKVREDIDQRSAAFVAMATNGNVPKARKEPANYWFDRRHIEKFEVRVQSYRTLEGELLTLIRILEPAMIDIYGQ